jgi:hypothetical protein
MLYTWWDAVKDLLGAIGPVIIAFPWFSDFFLRKEREELDQVPVAGNKLANLKDSLIMSLQTKIESPKVRDVVWTIFGLACIFTSFLIAFVRGIPDLF